MTHDYEAALVYFEKNPSTAEQYVWINEAIRHALSEMQRMKTEGLVMVPLEPTEKMLRVAGFNLDTWSEIEKEHQDHQKQTFVRQYKAMIAAQITGDEK
jgi:hypothetical protein